MIVAKIVKFCGVVRSHLLQAKLKWCRLIWTTVGLLRPSMCLKQPAVTLISSCIGHRGPTSIFGHAVDHCSADTTVYCVL